MRVEIDLRHHACKIKTRVFTASPDSNVTYSMPEFIKYPISRSQNKTAEIINFIELKSF